MDRLNKSDRALQRSARALQKAHGIKYTEALRRAKQSRDSAIEKEDNDG